MAEITANTSLQELASILSQTLMAGGVEDTLSGGAAVSIYTDNRYQSKDLDFVSSAAQQTLAALIRPLEFVETDSRRLFAHPQTQWLLEFPPGPLGFGLLVVDSSTLESLNMAWIALLPIFIGEIGSAGNRLSGSHNAMRSIGLISGAGAVRRVLSEQDWMIFRSRVGEASN